MKRLSEYPHTKLESSIPFSFTATVDADLSPNDRGFKRLSDVFAASQRTFPVVGRIETNTASQARVTNYPATPLAPADCPTPGTGVKYTSGAEANAAHPKPE